MFICVDLKVIEGLSDAVARSANTGPDRVLAGLVRLWHYCWSTELDHLGRSELAGIFGAVEVDALIASLVALGFLEESGDVWRVCGASRYLKLKSSRRRGAQFTNDLRRSRALPSDAQSDALERGSSVARSRSFTESPSHRVTEKKKEEAISADASALIAKWLDICAELPQWSKTEPVSKGRRALVAKALARRPLEKWAEVFSGIAASSFCQGSNDRGWKADLEWALRAEGKKPETAALVLEGKYADNGISAPKKPQAPVEYKLSDGDPYADQAG